MDMRTLLALALFMAATPVRAQETAPVDTTAITETIEVKRADDKELKHESLRFLRDNREFVRGQLDRLRLKVTREVSTEAMVIDARFLQLQELSRAVAAARDTVQDGSVLAAQRELLDSITRLGDIEAELALMESLLAEQRGRLMILEQDFLGHQETALVVVVRGLAGQDAPDGVVLTDETNVTRVAFTPEQRAALAEGGVAQVYHEFVEPRAHVVSVSFTGGTWPGAEPVAATFDAPRDRLTFLEMDLGPLAQTRTSNSLITRVWYR